MFFKRKASYEFLSGLVGSEVYKGQGKPCKACVPTANALDWSFVAGGPCDDGDPCTGADACDNGGCQGDPDKACDDGNTTTDGDVCTAGFCAGVAPPPPPPGAPPGDPEVTASGTTDTFNELSCIGALVASNPQNGPPVLSLLHL